MPMDILMLETLKYELTHSDIVQRGYIFIFYYLFFIITKSIKKIYFTLHRLINLCNA